MDFLPPMSPFKKKCTEDGLADHTISLFYKLLLKDDWNSPYHIMLPAEKKAQCITLSLLICRY